MDRSVVADLPACEGDDVASLYAPVDHRDPRPLLIAAGRVDADERTDRIWQASTRVAHVIFLVGVARDDLDEHGGIAAELCWAY